MPGVSVRLCERVSHSSVRLQPIAWRGVEEVEESSRQMWRSLMRRTGEARVRPRVRKRGSGLPLPKGAQRSSQSQRSWVRLAGRISASQRWEARGLRREDGRAVGAEAIAKEADVRGAKGEADSVGVAAEAMKRVPAGAWSQLAAWAAVRASRRWKPSIERPEPWASSSWWVRTRAGRWVRSTTREARMPRTPRCQAG